MAGAPAGRRTTARWAACAARRLSPRCRRASACPARCRRATGAWAGAGRRAPALRRPTRSRTRNLRAGHSTEGWYLPLQIAARGLPGLGKRALSDRAQQLIARLLTGPHDEISIDPGAGEWGGSAMCWTRRSCGKRRQHLLRAGAEGWLVIIIVDDSPTPITLKALGPRSRMEVWNIK